MSCFRRNLKALTGWAAEKVNETPFLCAQHTSLQFEQRAPPAPAPELSADARPPAEAAPENSKEGEGEKEVEDEGKGEKATGRAGPGETPTAGSDTDSDSEVDLTLEGEKEEEKKGEKEVEDEGPDEGKGEEEVEDDGKGEEATGGGMETAPAQMCDSVITHFVDLEPRRINDRQYRLGIGWEVEGTKGRCGYVVETTHYPNRSYVSLVLLERVDDGAQFIVCALKPSTDRLQLARHAVFPLSSIASAELPGTPVFDEKTFADLGDTFFQQPEKADCTHAPDFALQKRRRMQRKLGAGAEPFVIEEEREEGEEVLPTPKAAKPKGKKKKQTTAPATPGQFFYKCTHVFPNGKKCNKTFPKKQSLNNHMRTHRKSPSPKSGSSTTRRRTSNQVESVLKLTVSLDAYTAMTAKVGEKGRKKKEIRTLGSASGWIESRLDGRHYDSVKIYGGVGGFIESAQWTRFVCHGYNRAGAKGANYRVEGMGDDEGWELWVNGEVWEIHLGEVIERHYGDGEQEPEPHTSDDEATEDESEVVRNLRKELARERVENKRRKKQKKQSYNPPEYHAVEPAPAVEGGQAAGTSMESAVAIFKDAQERPMQILEDMIKLQQAQLQMQMKQASEQLAATNPKYTVDEIKAIKGT